MHENILNGLNKNGMNGLVSAAEANSRSFMMAAAVGAGVGIAVTAMDDRANFATVALSTIAGISYVSSIANNAELAMFDDTFASCATVSAIGFGVTGLVGGISNVILGSKNNGVTEL